MSSIERRLSGLAWGYSQCGERLDRKDRHITTVLAGIRRKHARPPVQKEAILPDDLRDMLATLRPGEWQGAQLLGTGLELRQLVAESRLGSWQLGSSRHLVMVNDRAQFQLKREDLRQEAALFLALDSVAGPLLAGASLALDRHPGDSRWVLWTELGFNFD